MQKRTSKSLNLLYTLFLITFIIFIKIVSFSILPEKYFYDSERIFMESIYGIVYIDKSYNFASNFFRTINVFKIVDYKMFSIFITMLFLYLIIKYYKFNINNILLDILLCILISIYVLGPTKEIIQLIMNIIFLKIIQNNTKNNLKRFLFISILFIFFSYFFRSYLILQYIIMLILFLFVLSKNNKLRSAFILVVLIIILLSFIKVFSYENYITLINIRHEVNMHRIDSTDANTIILDVFNNNNNSIFIFLINYTINLLRLLFPFELILKGIKYLPYIIFQVYISCYLIKFFKYVEKNIKYKYIYAFLISFYAVSALFEPDYGSFLRHQVPILFMFKYIYNSVIYFND